MTKPEHDNDEVNPFAPDTTPVARIEPDDADDTPDGAWRWCIVQAGTGAVLDFGGSGSSKRAASRQATAALDALTAAAPSDAGS